MEYYSTLKRKEIPPFATTWMICRHYSRYIMVNVA
jgi:hypothetical protein